MGRERHACREGEEAEEEALHAQVSLGTPRQQVAQQWHLLAIECSQHIPDGAMVALGQIEAQNHTGHHSQHCEEPVQAQLAWQWRGSQEEEEEGEKKSSPLMLEPSGRLNAAGRAG